MRIRFIFISILCLLLGLSGISSGKDKKVLSPPKWIQGSWSNLAESNTDLIDIYSFSREDVTAREGFFGEKVSLLERYGQSGFSEEIKPDLYRIVFNSKEGRVIYEFKLRKSGEADRYQNPVLSVKVVLFGVVHRNSSGSINTWFMKQ